MHSMSPANERDIHLPCAAISTPAPYARVRFAQTFTFVYLRIKYEYHRNDAARCVGRTLNSIHADSSFTHPYI